MTPALDVGNWGERYNKSDFLSLINFQLYVCLGPTCPWFDFHPKFPTILDCPLRFVYRVLFSCDPFLPHNSPTFQAAPTFHHPWSLLRSLGPSDSTTDGHWVHHFTRRERRLRRPHPPVRCVEYGRLFRRSWLWGYLKLWHNSDRSFIAWRFGVDLGIPLSRKIVIVIGVDRTQTTRCERRCSWVKLREDQETFRR